MKLSKIFSACAIAVVAQGAYAAKGETATATANWQGQVPGVIQANGFVITGEGGALVTPVGQLMRAQNGAIVAPNIQLEARNNEGTAAAPVAGKLVSDTERDDGAGGTESRSIEWTVADVAFYANGTPVTGIEWSVQNDGTRLATVTSTGVTQVAAHRGDILLLNAVSTSDTSAIDAYTGQDAALSVTVVASEL
ncbi:hypothetical protein WFH67_07845 [Vibrio vulnificus]|uniref:hypothetical protein n=1 Tax=Vibrio vulnificus TaxID=672 RepID=UPI000CD32222|nr:hypothetical protein [Vibrio vulnificus]EGR0752165.1 hypothetical protein [Vibrio vulnificus]EGR7975940.1 hypothetical protein [Vibrio vulnificus]EHV5549526.1 hypothetical protein [Vibrio vulnificus]EHZ2551278.1 hypothetical protein [Vibrio vulnificus]EHZ2655573.1 hypothetical protein [Vibrio vulnificus]